MANAAVADPPDELIPDPTVWKEFGISSMTGWRWTNDPALGFPPPVKIRNRKFRSRRALEAFKQRLLIEAATQRNRAA
jgi:predicted DNA-binding transcriptional regulator AlpA